MDKLSVPCARVSLVKSNMDTGWESILSDPHGSGSLTHTLAWTPCACSSVGQSLEVGRTGAGLVKHMGIEG